MADSDHLRIAELERWRREDVDPKLQTLWTIGRIIILLAPIVSAIIAGVLAREWGG